MSAQLSKSLGVYRGTALLMNIVIGAGLLTLPGLAVKVAGGSALAAWLICAAAAVPLLAVFIILGSRYPDAGGITSYAGRAFGGFGQRATSLLFLGAVVFGLPSIALTGGHYLATVFGGSAHVYAVALLLSALLPHLMPGEGAAKAMAWIASTVLAVILVFIVAGFVGLSSAPPATAAAPAIAFDPLLAIAPFMMLVFAFTGWEVGAGIAEEFRNPKRDYPLAMILSFAAATGLYLAIAWLAQRVDLAGSFEAPFVAIVKPVLGAWGATAVALTAALIIFANLAGAVWGVSRMVFGLARDGLLPSPLANARNGRPMTAVAATVGALLIVLLADAVFHFGMERLLGLAGQNFLILYGLAAAALVVLGRSGFDRALGTGVVALAGLLLALQGAMLLYPALLVAIAGAIGLVRRSARGVAPGAAG
jgi:amino acid efflux transporter